MKWRAIGLAALVTLARAACSGIRVQSDWDPAVDFSQFHSFTFLENEEPALNRAWSIAASGPRSAIS